MPNRDKKIVRKKYYIPKEILLCSTEDKGIQFWNKIKKLLFKFCAELFLQVNVLKQD